METGEEGLRFPIVRLKGAFVLSKVTLWGDKGEVESNLTSVYPYVGYEFGENGSVWGTLGIGEGDVTITQQSNRSTKADVSMRMGAVGAKGHLLSEREGDGMDMTLKTDGMLVQMDSETTRRNGIIRNRCNTFSSHS